ncbi:hypothetical protein P8C59_006892 [Phyllachora maydis]|uniref:Uncharacterized protein n=1 Tax=Phyllachora maydis TaxID=1825666 RepID=A0AAD9I778_9PEZI|nr:hypothetical protein P8C59_006892 [Phyllachora maydis]
MAYCTYLKCCSLLGHASLRTAMARHRKLQPEDRTSGSARRRLKGHQSPTGRGTEGYDQTAGTSDITPKASSSKRPRDESESTPETRNIDKRAKKTKKNHEHLTDSPKREVDSAHEAKKREKKAGKDKKDCEQSTDGPERELESAPGPKKREQKAKGGKEDKKENTPGDLAPVLFVIDVNPTKVDLASVPTAPSPISDAKEPGRACSGTKEGKGMNLHTRRRLKLIAREKEKLQRRAGIEPGSTEQRRAEEKKAKSAMTRNQLTANKKKKRTKKKKQREMTMVAKA